MITESIFDWAQKTPEKIAVIHNDRIWSYRAFAEQIAIARGYFLKRGLTGPGYAAVATQGRMDFWIVSLALRSLGLTTVAVGSTAMLGELPLPDIRCVVTLAGETWPGLARLCQTRGLMRLAVSLDDDPQPNAALSQTPHAPGGHILLTSGTTGRFKMLLSTPANDAASLRWRTEVTGLTRDSVLSVFAFESWTAAGYRAAANPWIIGGTTVMDHGREPHRALLNRSLTHGVIVPSLLQPILDAPPNAFPRNDGLQLAVTGGAMTRRQIEQAKARITPRLFVLLGATEVGSFAYTPLETDDDQRWHRLLPRTVELVSETGVPVTVGEVGRVRIRTKGGPTGYLGDEEATNTHFKDGYFYPGDLAVQRADGRIALQGRSTDVINVRGAKVFPGPIEDRLCEILDVSGACLLSMQNDSGEEELYVAIETILPIDTARVRAALDGIFVERPYSRARVFCVSALPRNPMGKVMRQAVRDRIAASRSRPR